MAIITFNSNLAALNATRRLTESTSSLASSSEKLSSGLRINSAKDDAAGLSVADLLRTDVRVSNQAIRNANEAISMVTIAESATRELNSILIRIQELATQSANETLSSSERDPLQEEVNSLVAEYNRITESTEFNNKKLIDGSFDATSIQLGYGTVDSIGLDSGEKLERNAFTGVFSNENDSGIKGDAEAYLTDIDQDGDLDGVLADSSNVISIIYNDGTGQAESTKDANVTPGGTLSSFVMGDFNGDGYDDAIFGDSNGNLYTNFNDGAGSFSGESLLGNTGANIEQLINIGDVDGDNLDDVAFTAGGIVWHANSTTGFTSLTKITTGFDVAAGDFNGDGYNDVALTSSVNDIIQIYENDGSGNFSAAGVAGAPTKGAYVNTGDFNNDGYDDIVTSVSGSLRISLSNSGDGSFTDLSNVTGLGSYVQRIDVGDYDKDGNLDIIGLKGAPQFLAGNGDGTFASPVGSSGPGYIATGYAIGDIDGNGAVDLLMTSGSGAHFMYGESTRETTLQAFDISSRDAALTSLSELDTAMNRVSSELGELGAATSRLETAVSELFKSREVLSSAESSIRDADVATESANLVRSQILQQTAADVLQQANAQPELALSLLDF